MKTLRSMSGYPCTWDDLIDDNNKTVVTIQTLESARLEGFESPGISVGEDGVFDVVVDVPELTEDVVIQCLKDLSKFAGSEYVYSREDMGKLWVHREETDGPSD